MTQKFTKAPVPQQLVYIVHLGLFSYKRLKMKQIKNMLDITI